MLDFCAKYGILKLINIVIRCEDNAIILIRQLNGYRFYYLYNKILENLTQIFDFMLGQVLIIKYIFLHIILLHCNPVFQILNINVIQLKNANSLAEHFNKGIQKEEKQKSIKIAKALLKEGIDLEKVIKITRLSEEEINNTYE